MNISTLTTYLTTMNLQPLKHAIEEQDTFTAALLVNRFFQPDLKLAVYQHKLAQMAAEFQVSNETSAEQKFKLLVEYFYKQLAFSGNDQDFFSSKYSLLTHAIDYRTGIPATIAVIFSELARLHGLAVKGVNFPGHFLLRFDVNADRAIFVDPLNGNILNWSELEAMYFYILGELEEEQMPVEALDGAKAEEIVVRLLHNLKGAFIKEEKYQQALSGVDLLVQLCPDDPYERRDRGFLLHQLDCHLLAKADYQFFIEQCPQDPAAQLLKIQIKNLEHPPVVLH